MISFLDSDRRKALKRITLTPLADLVFILLVFFILETNFSNHFQISYQLPNSAAARANASPSLRMQLFPGGLVWIDNRSVQVQQLGEFIAEKHFPSDTAVTLEVHQSSRLQPLVQTLDHLYAAKLNRTRIVSLEENIE